MHETIKNLLYSIEEEVYPGNVPQGIEVPYINFKVADTLPSNTKTGPSEADVISMIVDIYAETLLEAKILAVSARNALDYYSDATITSIVFRSQSDDFSFSADYSMVRQEYSIRMKV